MKFEKRKTTKLLEFLRPDYITVGRENSKVSSGRHTLLSIVPSISIHGKFGNLSTSVVLAVWCT